jgi:polysaccharide pyruvyl transferase WcaK-like protein
MSLILLIQRIFLVRGMMKDKGKSVLLFDTSIATSNIGDAIIMESINRILAKLFLDIRVSRVSSHQSLGLNGARLCNDSDLKILCGSNMLGSLFLKRSQLKIGLGGCLAAKDMVLMGVGWRQYQDGMHLYNKLKLKRLLSKDKLHSVRDGYTEKILKNHGFNNVINTSCPTTWSLTEEHMSGINYNKSKEVLFTLTDYGKNYKKDRKMICELQKIYDKVYFWPQGLHDISYFNDLGVSGISVLPPTLHAFNDILSRHDIDYVGTRLHAGIKALQHKRRALIIGIDNRAIELSKDTGISVLKRENMCHLPEIINELQQPELHIPFDAITKWMDFYKELIHSKLDR